MKLLPTESIIYKTKLKESEIINRLSDLIEPKKILRLRFFSNSAKPYEGQINGQTFSIKRIINYRNSFLPRINGAIQDDIDNTIIRIKMRLHLWVIIFICIWCIGVGLTCLAVLIQIVNQGTFDLAPAIIIPFIMLIFMYTLTMRAFKYESDKSIKDLQELFDAEIIDL